MRSDGGNNLEAASCSSQQSPASSVNNAGPSATRVYAMSQSPEFINRLEILSTRIPDFYIAPFCGASAGVASGIVTCPLDVIKTKLQAQGGFARRGGQTVDSKALYRGMLGTGKAIFREDGIRGLYQGLGPMLLGYLPTWAVYLAVYDRSREYFFEKTGEQLLPASIASMHLVLIPQFRQLVALPWICCNYCRRLLDHCNKSHLGHQNETYVAKPQTEQ